MKKLLAMAIVAAPLCFGGIAFADDAPAAAPAAQADAAAKPAKAEKKAHKKGKKASKKADKADADKAAAPATEAK